MRKRIRKKRRLGEFQEFGFEVRFGLPSDFSERDQDAFFDAFISEAIESNRLMCGGGCGREWDVFIAKVGRGSATENHRKMVGDWLRNSPYVFELQIGPLVDAWYPE